MSGIVRSQAAQASLVIDRDAIITGTTYSIGGAGNDGYNLFQSAVSLRIATASNAIQQAEAGKRYVSSGIASDITLQNQGYSYSRIFNNQTDSEQADKQISVDKFKEIDGDPVVSQLLSMAQWTNNFIMDNKTYSVTVNTLAFTASA